MGDIVIGERWNTSESLDMALGVRRAIDSILSQRRLPAECKTQLQKSVEFLNEARGGSAILAGTLTEADSFTGFSPLCLAIDVLIRFKGSSVDESKDAKKISVLFQNYINALQQVEKGGNKPAVNKKMLQEIAQFFEVLTDLLLQQADPITKEFSHAYLLGRVGCGGQV